MDAILETLVWDAKAGTRGEFFVCDHPAVLALQTEYEAAGRPTNWFPASGFSKSLEREYGFCSFPVNFHLVKVGGVLRRSQFGDWSSMFHNPFAIKK